MKRIDNIQKYVETLRKTVPAISAKKNGGVIARVGKEGEEIRTFVSNGILETINCVKRDKNGDLGIVATTADSFGNRIIDENGHMNTYIIERKTFEEKYLDSERVTETDQLFNPRGGTQRFIQTNEDISFLAPWGEEEHLKAGGFLNITDPNSIYGIAYEEFILTYTIENNKDHQHLPNEGLK